MQTVKEIISMSLVFAPSDDKGSKCTLMGVKVIKISPGTACCFCCDRVLQYQQLFSPNGQLFQE
jgi:hypothetical protein